MYELIMSLICIVLFLWVVIDSEQRPNRLFWIILALIFPVLGSALYYIYRKPKYQKV